MNYLTHLPAFSLMLATHIALYQHTAIFLIKKYYINLHMYLFNPC